jgi:hypothetical protein
MFNLRIKNNCYKMEVNMGDVNQKSEKSIIFPIIQSTVLIITCLWAIIQFSLKEIIWPQTSPVNISLDIKPDEQKNYVSNRIVPKLKPYIVHISVTNPGTRIIYLDSGRWIARGYKIEKNTFPDYYKFNRNNVLHNPEYSIQPDYIASHAKLIGFGGLLTDAPLFPKETINRSFIIYIPFMEYDYMEIETVQPTMTKYKGAIIVWPDEDDIDLKLNLCDPQEKLCNGKIVDMTPDKNNIMGAKVDLQYIRTTVALSLW